MKDAPLKPPSEATIPRVPSVRRKTALCHFFWDPPLACSQRCRAARIVALHNASIYQIQQLLRQEGMSAAWATSRTSSPRRHPAPAPPTAASAISGDHQRRKLDLASAPSAFFCSPSIWLVCSLIRDRRHARHTRYRPVVRCAPLSGIGRPSQVMAETLDEGLALFAG